MKISATILAVLLCLPVQLLARTTHVIPEGELTSCGGTELYCYDFETAKQLFLADASCGEFRLELRFFKDVASSQASAIANLSSLVDDQGLLIELLVEAHNELFLEYKKMTEDYIDARSRDILGGGLFLFVGAIAVSFTAGVVLMVVLK